MLKTKTTKVSKVEINGIDEAKTATSSKNTTKVKDSSKAKKSKKNGDKVKWCLLKYFSEKLLMFTKR